MYTYIYIYIYIYIYTMNYCTARKNEEQKSLKLIYLVFMSDMLMLTVSI
jgi:hypothetical protein